ncbi:neuronal tyrosine-phosphorylated phosphoinositide-3-kinase adapter 1-like [Haemorhous mexicanus]|uniref:neuronal tyrosine-phosphorylated phosphoinositide-3-kinase adapter 1-like n=1 Tax=Haemorhous mexicanus TaxID=30427 RepID=UPI0028BE561F|nr:neuronal tyrosine-phosphorylated phosphoinositide-3-kinase adapter 1-like [Haemorhous mexicanus]XP_059728680.1 neuronal tyrosine-phosphorylated phosphoinositide-3-kinase adapter 1-like [Haemorhous mexicanus]
MSAPPRSELAAAAAALLRLGEERPPAAAMSLLQRKGRPEWRPREEEPRKGVPKAREGGSLRRPLRVGFLTLPAPQERGPRPCAPGMAPRSLSCHAVGLPDPGGPPLRPPGPRTGPPEGRGLEAPPAKRGGAPRGGCVRQTPPLKPSRSPQTRLSAGAPPAALAEQGEAEEPVYIEMVGDARGGAGGDPRRGGPGTAPAPPAEEPEAIYEEMSCPLPAGEGPGPGHAPFQGHAPFHGHAPHAAHAPFGGPAHHSAHAPYAGHAPFSGHAPHAGRAPFIGHAPFSGPAPIPPPFPNLLPPRPPPLAPPPEGASRLPLPSRRDAPPPARARSHSTPLPPHHAPGGAGRERGGAGLGPLPLPPSAEAPPPGKRPPAYESLRGGVASAGPALAREEEPPLRRGGGASARRGKETEKAPEPPREERGGAGAAPPPSGIPVRAEGPRGRPGPPLPCQTFPACGRASELPGGPRLGRSASTSGVRQAGAPPFPRGPPPSRPLSGGVPGGAFPAAPRPRDGQLQEVIDRKRCVCTEIKARGGRGGGLCKQDSLPPLPAPPAWKGPGVAAAEGRPPPPPPPGTPPARRPHAVLWDTAI